MFRPAIYGRMGIPTPWGKKNPTRWGIVGRDEICPTQKSQKWHVIPWTFKLIEKNRMLPWKQHLIVSRWFFSTPLKNISPNGNLPQIGVKMKTSLKHPYPLDWGGRGIYVRYILASKIPENMPSTFFQAILGKNVPYIFWGIHGTFKGKCTCTFFRYQKFKPQNVHGTFWGPT